MSKRKIEDNNKSTPAAKKIAGQQNESCVSSPEERVFVYHQGHIDVKSLYLATKLADVYFTFDSDVGTITRIPAHKNLLAVTSDVFEKMFCGELKVNGDVKIVDASEEAFKEFLQFFYLSKVKLSAEHLTSVLYLGNKYNVEKCIDACVKFFTDNLSNENVCTALSLAILHDQEDLTKLCEKRIMLNTADVFKSAGFLECSKETLAHILKENLLSCSEVDVFEACMQWVRAKSGQQELSKALVEEHLGDLFYEIRFASLTTKEFLKLEVEYSVVLSSDFKAIVRLIEGLDIDSKQFNTTPRQFEWNKEKDSLIVCRRDDYYCSREEYCRVKEKTTFSSNVPLVFGQFMCNGIYSKKRDDRLLKSDVSVEVKITEARTLDDAKVLCSMTANLGSNYTTVSLPHPILIRPDLLYTICIRGLPASYCFKSYELASLLVPEPKIQIEFHNDRTIGCSNYGLVKGLNFNRI